MKGHTTCVRTFLGCTCPLFLTQQNNEIKLFDDWIARSESNLTGQLMVILFSAGLGM